MFPFLSGLFGFLATHHIRGSSELKANRASGLAMESIFLTLIFTGLGLYYAPANFRPASIATHRWSEVLLPPQPGLALARRLALGHHPNP